MAEEHISVLIGDIVNILKEEPHFDGREKTCFVDCTFGRGGYTRQILENIPNSFVIGIDRDEIVKKYALNEKKGLHLLTYDEVVSISNSEDKQQSPSDT